MWPPLIATPATVIISPGSTHLANAPADFEVFDDDWLLTSEFYTPVAAQCKGCQVVIFIIIFSHKVLFFLMSAIHSLGGALTGLEA
jgi:hypothetical protein